MIARIVWTQLTIEDGICSSKHCTSLENRLRIVPELRESKKLMGASATAAYMRSWSLAEARVPIQNRAKLLAIVKTTVRMLKAA